MYCQKCGSDNIETARFCRKCGSYIFRGAEISQSYSDRPVDTSALSPKSLDPNRAVKKISTGIALLCIAVYFAIAHERWGLWILFPAFVSLGKGISMLIAIRASRPQVIVQAPSRGVEDLYTPVQAGALTTGEVGADTGFIEAPPSVTEGTTRIIAPASTQHPEVN